MTEVVYSEGRLLSKGSFSVTMHTLQIKQFGKQSSLSKPVQGRRGTQMKIKDPEHFRCATQSDYRLLRPENLRDKEGLIHGNNRGKPR